MNFAFYFPVKPTLWRASLKKNYNWIILRPSNTIFGLKGIQREVEKNKPVKKRLGQLAEHPADVT